MLNWAFDTRLHIQKYTDQIKKQSCRSAGLQPATPALVFFCKFYENFKNTCLEHLHATASADIISGFFCSEGVVCRCSSKQVYIKFCNIQRKTIFLGSLFNKVSRPQSLLKRDFDAGAFLRILRNF